MTAMLLIYACLERKVTSNIQGKWSLESVIRTNRMHYLL